MNNSLRNFKLGSTDPSCAFWGAPKQPSSQAFQLNEIQIVNNGMAIEQQSFCGNDVGFPQLTIA